MLIFMYAAFELKVSLHYKVYKFPTETFGDTLFLHLASCFLVDVPLLDLHLVSSLENF
jgi:hypothetical protein